MRLRPILASFAIVLLGASLARAATIKIVSTLPAYASIAQFVGGDRVTSQSIGRPDEDAHFVKPKPSLALMLRGADLFVTTGLDLELWGPVLVDKSGNARIREGQPGYVSASRGVPLLDVPANPDRAAGDIHIYGNPHIYTSPLNAKLIAANIAAGLARIDPAGAAAYEANLAAFDRRIDEALYGKELATTLGSAVLDPLARDGKLVAFLETHELGGVPLLAKLGGWLGKGRLFRDRKIVAYHKNWIYFTDLFGLRVADYVEPKPGIPPSAKHVHDLIEEIDHEHIQVLLAANYFSRQQVEGIAQRAGIQALVVPFGPGVEGAPDYFAMVDDWIDGLARAFSKD